MDNSVVRSNFRGMMICGAVAIAIGLTAGCTTAPSEVALADVGGAEGECGGRWDERAVHVSIVWIDHTAIRHQIGDYEFWDIPIAIAVRVNDAEPQEQSLFDPWSRAGYTLWQTFLYYGKDVVQVVDWNDQPVAHALPYEERFAFGAPGVARAMELVRDEDVMRHGDWVISVRAARVSLGERPEPGMYRMRLIPNLLQKYAADDGWCLDDQWQNFVIGEVRDERFDENRPFLDRPMWYGLPDWHKPSAAPGEDHADEAIDQLGG